MHGNSVLWSVVLNVFELAFCNSYDYIAVVYSLYYFASFGRVTTMLPVLYQWYGTQLKIKNTIWVKSYNTVRDRTHVLFFQFNFFFDNRSHFSYLNLTKSNLQFKKKIILKLTKLCHRLIQSNLRWTAVKTDQESG